MMSHETTTAPAPVDPAPGSTVGLRLLGRLSVRGADGWVDVQVGRAATMFALLASEAGRVVSYDRLVEQLWGEDPPRAVRSTVYANVSRLRATLRGTAFGIEARAPGYVLTGPPAAIDVHSFADSVRTAEHAFGDQAWAEVLSAAQDALGTWAEPFGGAVAREDLTHERARLDRLCERASELVVLAHLATGRADDATRGAVDLVRRDPYNETYWRLRMSAEHAAGRTAAALETYARLRAFLGEELGIDPGERSRSLHLQILREADAGADAPDASDAPDRPDRPGSARGPRAPEDEAPAPSGGPLPEVRVPVGRRDEVRAIDDALARASAGVGRLVLLEGEPGIGKTRLAEYAADRGARTGALVVWSRAIRGPGTPPLWMWESVLRDLRRAEGSVEPVDLDPAAGAAPEQARFRLYERIASEVLAATVRRPLALVLDDLQWADEGTLHVLHLLGQRLRGHRCLVVATSRPRTGLRVDPLAATLRSGHVDRWWLEPFGARDVDEMVRAWQGELDLEMRPADVASLHDRTGGNPYLLTEVLRDGGTVRVPASVRDIVERRLGELSGAARSVLEHAALAGRRVDPALIARALGTSVADVVRLLEPVRAEGLVVSDQATRTLAFVHDLTREAIAERVAGADVLDIHGRLADAIAALHAEDPAAHLDELADHRYLSTGGAPSLAAYEACMAAADQSASVHAYEQAALHRQRALEMLAPGAAHRDMRFEVLFELSSERRLAGDVLGAAQGLSQALEVARTMGDPVLLRRGLALLGDVTTWNWRHFDEVDHEVVAALEEALARDDVATRSQAMPPAERARVLGTLAVELYYGDDRARGQELALESVALARTLDDPALLGRTLNNLVIAAWSPERDGVRRAALDESLALADRGLPQATETIARLHRAPLRLQEADVAGFVEDLARAEWLAGRVGRPELQAQAASQWMGYHLVRGDLGAAREALATTYRVLGATSLWGAEWVQLMGRTAMARVEGTLGDVVGTLVDRARRDERLYRWTALLALGLEGQHRDARLLQAQWGLTSPPRSTYWGSHFEWAQAAEVALLLGHPDPAACDALLARLGAPLVLVGTALAVWGPVDLLRARLAEERGDDAAAARHRARADDVEARTEAALGTAPVWPLARFNSRR